MQKTWDDLKELLNLIKELFSDPSQILKLILYAFHETIDAFIDPNVNAYERMYNVGGAMAQIIIPVIPDVIIAVGTGGAIKAGKVIAIAKGIKSAPVIAAITDVTKVDLVITKLTQSVDLAINKLNHFVNSSIDILGKPDSDDITHLIMLP